MEDLAQRLAESEHGPETAEALLDRWDGRPEHIAEDIFRTRNLETGQIEDLTLFYPYQPKILHAYFFSDASIKNVYKGRRIGVSFVICVALAIDAMRTPGGFFPIVSRTKAQSESRIGDIRGLIEHSKVMDVDDLVTDNKGELELPNGARIKAYTGDPEGARGDDSANAVFVDEMAFLDDQEATMRAFMPFISLGNAQMLQVSTPKVSNDLFLQTHRRGSPVGVDGVVALKQPTFTNAEDIDPTVSLFNQHVEPVRPDLNIETVEAERAQDPQGFAQEYLCQPVSDEYRFFAQQKVEAAQRRGAADPTQFQEGVGGGKATGDRAYWHPATHARCGGTMVMGVDIGIDRDDTAIAVFEHVGNHRYLRFHTLLDRSDLRALNVYPENAKHPEAVADYIYRLSENMGVAKVFLDMTGPGRGFQEAVQSKLGKRAQGFNFSNRDEVTRMFGDFNFGLHKDLITLVPDAQIHDQLLAIVKEQRHEHSKPKFSGKDYAEDGKDDMAYALILGAYPPSFDADRSTQLHQREEAYSGYEAEEAQGGEGEAFRGVKTRSAKRARYGDRPTIPEGVALTRADNRPSTEYTARHRRRRTRR